MHFYRGQRLSYNCQNKAKGSLDACLMFFSWGFFSSAEDEDKDNNTDAKESALSQLIREQLIKGDVNTEVPTLARMVKIVVASMHEGTPLCIRNLMTCLQMQGV